jgi:hypothetical protein
MRLAMSSLEEIEEEEADSSAEDGWMRMLECLERAIEGLLVKERKACSNVYLSHHRRSGHCGSLRGSPAREPDPISD